jgi:hypothetical protein
MRWTSVFIYFSAIALLGALISQLTGWTGGRTWFLLFWAVLLLPTSIGLFTHPMRAPAWGLFVGFWGTVAVLWLIVLQVLAVWDVLKGPAYTGWTAWPLAIIGFWFVVACGSGFGGKPYPALVDLLGLITGAGLIGISVAAWTANADLTRSAGIVAAVAYCLWAIGLGWVVWNVEPPRRAFRMPRPQAQL